jgi:ABC-type transport system involved in multi-copper enzyme maturation permease subunit
VNPILTIALASFTEARRNRVTLIVVAFALVMLLSTSVIINITVFTLDRVATDFGLGTMSLLMVGLAIYLSSNQLSREIDRRTIFLTLSRPISRAQFVLGRVVGTIITLWAMLAAMAVLFFAQLYVLHIDLTQAEVAAVAGLAVELVFLSTVGALFSSFAGPFVSSLASVGLYLIGHGSADLWDLAAHSKNDSLKQVANVIYWTMPELERLNYRLAAAYEAPIDWGKFGLSAGYAMGYAAVLLVIAVFAFERTDFK